MTAPVLYVIVCGSPAAWSVYKGVSLAQADGWDVCVVATPDGRKFIDVPALVDQTGYLVRSEYKEPGEPDLIPEADAMLVAPATVNTINKWAAGIADTLALGLLVEGQGRQLPIVAVPFTNIAMAAHPAFQANIELLRRWGITVLFGEDVMTLHPPRQGEASVDELPWEMALAALRTPGFGEGSRW